MNSSVRASQGCAPSCSMAATTGFRFATAMSSCRLKWRRAASNVSAVSRSQPILLRLRTGEAGPQFDLALPFPRCGIRRLLVLFLTQKSLDSRPLAAIPKQLQLRIDHRHQRRPVALLDAREFLQGSSHVGQFRRRDVRVAGSTQDRVVGRVGLVAHAAATTADADRASPSTKATVRSWRGSSSASRFTNRNVGAGAPPELLIHKQSRFAVWSVCTSRTARVTSSTVRDVILPRMSIRNAVQLSCAAASSRIASGGICSASANSLRSAAR